MDERAQRIGKNEALFREVNERIGEIAPGSTTEFLCECGDRSCTRPVGLTLAEYERVRSDPRWFAVLPGHQIEDVETVVEESQRFLVVEKHEGGPARLASERDPRS